MRFARVWPQPARMSAWLLSGVHFFQLVNLKAAGYSLSAAQLDFARTRSRFPTISSCCHRPESARYLSRSAAFLASLLRRSHQSLRGGGRQSPGARRRVRRSGGQMGTESRPDAGGSRLNDVAGHADRLRALSRTRPRGPFPSTCWLRRSVSPRLPISPTIPTISSASNS